MATADRKEVVLDSTLTASQARISLEVKHILIAILKEAIITVYHEYFYLVRFDPSVQPQRHIVTHDLFCACALESDCPAVVAIKVYLRGGGEIAKTPRPGYFPTCPHVCPICGSGAYYAPELSSKHRGVGWQCSQHGTSHYWEHQASVHRGNNSCKPVS